MRVFDIKKPNSTIAAALKDKIDNLTKPKGSLGMLEELAYRVGLIQQTLSPQLNNPNHILFGADHGIVEEGVSFSPKEVTWQQMGHFLKGGAGISFLCKQHNFKLNVVDSGVDFDFPSDCGIVDCKIRKGTRNFKYEAAITMEELEKAIDYGAMMVDRVYAQGCNVVCFGEMGVGNTSPSSMWMSYLGGVPLKECVGAGSGMVGKNLQHKLDVLMDSARNYQSAEGTFFKKYIGEEKETGGGFVSNGNKDYALEIMRWFGGYEMLMAVGGMLRAAELNMVILIDGFIMTNCLLAAKELDENVVEYAIFGHCGDESGHKRVLDILGGKPLISLGLRLGEGSGAICAYPIVVSAVNMINQMDSFKGASVTKYF
ncbi:MAG: nicotinate-nucleotide--dimethylbenzimidazole phosphoribosyltransferase [Bacteroidales bacterium]|nr:nicotinate-nucleotide--dimethylbenzimidazole phosphoribosyltransferase [Bacteroidales bacterium]